MSSPILYLQTEAAKNLLKSFAGTISDGYYENGPFYSNPEEDGKTLVKACDLSYHPACPEGFSPEDISRLEVKVNRDYKLFGLWPKDGDEDLRKYGILDFMDLLAYDRSYGRDENGCRRWGSLRMVGVLIATEQPKLGYKPEELSTTSHQELEDSILYAIYAKDVERWDHMLLQTMHEINEALRTSNFFSKDPVYGKLTHWKHYLSGGDCRWYNRWQRSYDSWSASETRIYEDWMLENPRLEQEP